MKVPSDSGTTATTINIPLNLDFQLVDQADIIEREFVDKETAKAINPIIDNEKAQLSPIDGSNELLSINYNVIFAAGNTYDKIGFVQDDIKFQRNAFKKSFLNLRFYDSPEPANQNFLFNVTLFPKLNSTHIAPGTNVFKSVNQLPISFLRSNPVKDPNGFAEGYYLYEYKDEISPILPPKSIYMDAEFNNAKDGKTTRLMTISTPQLITDLVKKIYTKYDLIRTVDGYFYQLDDTYNLTPGVSSNVTPGVNTVTVNLYERLTI